MKVGQDIVSCIVGTGITRSAVDDNQEDTGFLAVSLDGDNADLNTPEPKVKLADGTANETVYGALATFNSATNRCGVIVSGIVPMKKAGTSPTITEAADIGKGVIPDSTTNGIVGTGGAGLGRGTVVGRVANDNRLIWVDLDVDVNAV